MKNKQKKVSPLDINLEKKEGFWGIAIRPHSNFAWSMFGPGECEVTAVSLHL
jgi:hypothetical protein